MGMIDTLPKRLDATVVHRSRRSGRPHTGSTAPPVLYQYSSLLNEVLIVPSSSQNIRAVDENGSITDNRVSNTEGRIQIKGYLLRRIEGMKGKNSLKE